MLGAVVFATMVLAAQARTVFGDLRRLELEREIAREHLASAEADLAVSARPSSEMVLRSRATSGWPRAGKAALHFEARIDGRPVDPVEWRRRK